MADSTAPTDLPERDASDESEHSDESECSGENGLLPAELRSWMHLLAAAGAVEQQLRARVRDSLGISHDEFLVLCLLADQPGGGLRMTRIAELLGRPKTRLTYQVACLQHAGLVTKGSVCGDRRGIEVTLTEKARRLLKDTSPPLAHAITEAVTRALGPERRAALCGLLPDTADADRQPDESPDRSAS
ncbi:MarR family winged helix-turn-helix transcriptional regulator [Streptomyces ureilyticus]|uniref:MarR family transcriptional regulator n=1 Tax=Streptomyces ureilyticus TaxID=1775131 RepID=A0ABX0E9Q5_9ACTN|nr:MarR family transcriptional regulator [Streptomyces ureilyticus]NGO48557.1 MarR family transcriptional regulator [Streptomyces ureilyticus]